MPLPFKSPPENLCILRLSAVGDVCHTLAVVRTLQSHWPHTKLTWIIGKLEASLVGDIPGIEFIIFDKSKGWSAYSQLQKELRGRRFDALLHMQMSIRASIASLFIKSDIKLGFDKVRAKDFQWLFTNHTIVFKPRQHVLESLFEFAEALGVEERLLLWDIPVSEADCQIVDQLLPTTSPLLAISPCSSMNYRNWHVEGYAAVADYAIEKYGLRVVLTGGPSKIEQEYGERICVKAKHELVNLIGKTTLKQLLVVLKRSVGLVSPDSGPAHMATAVNTPVIGLYACTNPDRARPFLSTDYTIDKYHEAVMAKYGRDAVDMPWGIRVRDPGTMNRITIKEVKEKLDKLMRTIKVNG